MRIGLLTLMHGYNYGGILQCYALKRALEKGNHVVEVIDFHPRPTWRKIRRIGGLCGSWGDKHIVNSLSSWKYGRQIHNVFQSFRQGHLNLSPPCNSEKQLREVMNRYDAMVVGSDQVWNLDWNIPEYFFDFANDYKGRIFSYAACFGHRNQSGDALTTAGEQLQRFDEISVRNSMSQQIVKEISGRDSSIVADPTLLINFDDMAEQPRIPHKEYILLYALSKERYLSAVPHLKNIAEQRGLPIVAIQSEVLQNWDMSATDYCIKNPSVNEWLGLFKNAAFAFTDSFHGTLFSIKNRVPFLNYIGNAMSSERVAYAASRYGLSAGYHTPEDYRSDTVYDFDKIEQRTLEHVAESFDFIKTNTA